MNTEGQSLDDAALRSIAEELVLAMMASASTDKIRPMDWWERARTALELSVDAAESPQEMVTRFAKRIQAQTLSASTARRLSCLSSLDDPTVWQAFRRLVARQSTYIVAFAAERRTAEREEYAAEKAAKQPVEARLYAALDELKAVKADRDTWQSRARGLNEDVRVLRARLMEKDNEQG
jgi:hypothetical protein